MSVSVQFWEFSAEFSVKSSQKLMIQVLGEEGLRALLVLVLSKLCAQGCGGFDEGSPMFFVVLCDVK